MASDFITIVLKTGKTTRFKLKRGLTLIPAGLSEQTVQVYSSAGVLMYDIKEQH